MEQTKNNWSLNNKVRESQDQKLMVAV